MLIFISATALLIEAAATEHLVPLKGAHGLEVAGIPWAGLRHAILSRLPSVFALTPRAFILDTRSTLSVQCHAATCAPA